MKKENSKKRKFFGIICFFIAGIVSLISKEYILAFTFTFAAIFYLMSLKSKNVVKK